MMLTFLQRNIVRELNTFDEQKGKVEHVQPAGSLTLVLPNLIRVYTEKNYSQLLRERKGKEGRLNEIKG